MRNAIIDLNRKEAKVLQEYCKNLLRTVAIKWNFKHFCDVTLQKQEIATILQTRQELHSKMRQKQNIFFFLYWCER